LTGCNFKFELNCLIIKEAEKMNTVNPFNGEVLKSYQLMDTKEVLNIAKKSDKAFNSWKDLSIKERAAYFQKLVEVLKSNKEEYGTIMTQEMGKPIRESVPEVEKCAWFAEVLIEKGEEWLASEEAKADGLKHIITLDPLGPIFIIMPWNYPFWQVFKVALPPLMAGNTIILKHASNVTGSALLIEEIFKKAGFPEDVFRTVVCGHDSSAELVAAKEVAACSLTGSVGAGAVIAAQAGKQIKKTVLELGGADPHIILDDADIEVAAQGAALGRMSNAGQICIGSKRIIVHRAIAEQFTKRFVEIVKELKVGDPLDPETKVGPLAQAKAVAEMEDFVKDATSKGGKVLTGGKRGEGSGFFFEPTVISEITPDMDVASMEVFGPIAPVIVVDSDEEAIAIANDSEFGLNGSVWTKDLARGEKVARKINTGGVFINSISKSNPYLPLGGIKKSGYGRELGKEGIREFVNVKTINIYEHK
jgi:succinate-semialdehyde dehydrogenase/glutarate-semialdehyde dehydrogenase